MTNHEQALDFLHRLTARAEAEVLDHEGPWIVVSCDPTVHPGTSFVGPFADMVSANEAAKKHEDDLNKGAGPDDVPYLCYAAPLWPSEL
jgi:hypothetical protein